MRPSCEKIMDMPAIKKKIDKLFPEDQFFDSYSQLLSTIRVPKNLLYLTDRLPKPNYEMKKQIMDEEEKLRRKTHDSGALLPDIKNQKHKENSVQPPLKGKNKKETIGRKKPSETTDD
jgi:hypothetical protein